MKKPLLLIAGWLSLTIGLIGILIPLLPTTPFLLLSAWCFSCSSSRLHNWLNNHSWFGPAIQQWQQIHTVSRNSKIKALFLILISFTASLILPPLPNAGKSGLLLLALVLMWVVTRLPEHSQSDTALKTSRTPSILPTEKAS